MSNKKNKNKKPNKINNFPYSNEIKMMKDDFKKMIDEMPDEDFIDFYFTLMDFADNFEESWIEDEEWEDEAEIFYNENKNNINNFPTIENDDDLPL